VLTLDGNVLGGKFLPFDKFGELFSDWRLGCNGIGSNYLNAAKLCSLSRSMIAIKYPGARFSDYLFAH
jgi:hypothetical protein